MDPSWFLLVLSAAILVSLVLLVLVCVDCWNKGPMVSIRETNVSEEYMHSTEFRVVHPSHPPVDRHLLRSPPNLLPPQRVPSSVADPGAQWRHRSFTPTETDSNPSYENPVEGPPYENPDCRDSDIEDPGYIIVIPDGPAIPPSHPSRASTPSSDLPNEYVNLQEQNQEADEEREYLNVDPSKPPIHLISPALACSRRSSREEAPSLKDATSDSAHSESDDDYEGNYVNQPKMI
ncbi:linker for activation of T-cells family member 1-like [Echeneis naucrates]|uniref:linker for activation of T-cells family member 1-like n=1 Tax=Echeneis naucrates TaxID=173247 RepID=UPI0011142490|nr:linker for activation of T-cells family member 1 [Echeneis naucrates]XP_029364493.1 linker for activation of T-cells family member 1 [Echeneis naucrates]XP_029364495.1 linker for activation of T-cells family member 1 [Echeneis naucrates]